MTDSNLHDPLTVFFCYSHADEHLRNSFEKHLSSLKRQGMIAGWHDRKILPGEEWRGKIDENLDAAKLFLALVSADFLASEYCCDVEMARALDRRRQGLLHIIPIIVRPVDWNHEPLGELQALPTDGKPVTKWDNEDEAWTDVTLSLRKLISELSRHPL